MIDRLQLITLLIAIVGFVLGSIAISRQNSARNHRVFSETSSSNIVEGGLNTTVAAIIESVSVKLNIIGTPSSENIISAVKNTILHPDADNSVKNSLKSGDYISVVGNIPGVSGNSIVAEFRYSLSAGIPSVKYEGSNASGIELINGKTYTYSTI
jgi:hypothetical protein